MVVDESYAIIVLMGSDCKEEIDDTYDDICYGLSRAMEMSRLSDTCICLFF